MMVEDLKLWPRYTMRTKITVIKSPGGSNFAGEYTTLLCVNVNLRLFSTFQKLSRLH